MGDHREHRGPHPEDRLLFAADQHDLLRLATAELSWLLSRAYQMKSALKLVGDRHSLRERQRLAVSRTACTDRQQSHRLATSLPLASIRHQALVIDGFNLIITVEAALSGGVIFHCRDGCLRDLSSVHGSYRSVQETETAIALIGQTLAGFEPGSVVWFLDQPISNSGRLAQKIRACAAENHWPWTVEVVFNPDREVINSGKIVVSSDSIVLDNVSRWFDLTSCLLEQAPAPWIVKLGPTR